MTDIAAYAPRYIIHEGVWYVRKDHVAEQLGTAIESAFMDGMRFQQTPVAVKTRRGPRHQMGGEIVQQ